ncbi:terminase small subunit [Paenibacillus sp. USHLN196]|uniref:terminase small subunit n=1 Tax=Paenibacillus sp. USHLN196 TaxID=3081291 RepID=UPI0030197287
MTPNWEEIRRLFETSNLTLKELAEQYGIKDSTIRSRKNRENWQRGAAMQRNVATLQHAAPKVSEDSQLTDKQRIFIMEYLRDFNITRAAMAAGYSKRSAHVVGWETLRNPKVHAEIQRHKEMYTEALGLDIQRIIAEYMKIAFADITDFVDFGRKEITVGQDGEGQPITQQINFVDFKNADDVDGAIVSEIKIGKSGTTVKLADKMEALKMLDRYAGYMTEEQKARVAVLKSKVPDKDGFNPSAQIVALAEMINNPVAERVMDDD